MPCWTKKENWKKPSKQWGARLVNAMRETLILPKRNSLKLLVLDGCFIIERFRDGAGRAGKVPIQESEYILFSSGMILTICHDIFLLENQIPWFVFELLFDKTKGPEQRSGCKMTLVELAIGFIHSAFLLDGHQHQYPILKELLDSGSRILYITDLMGRYLGSSKEKGIKRPELKSRIHSIPCATRLREAGVKFEAVTSRNILDVRFNKKKGALEIPSLVIHPTTETIVRNLISFEQCNPWLWRPWAPSNVISYTMLLDTLVASTEDADLLCGSGIFGNWLNHKEAVDLLNRLWSGSHVDTFYYADLCKEVNHYCKRLSPKWRVSLIDYYFMKPWAVVSVIFAIIVLLFTIMQLDL